MKFTYQQIGHWQFVVQFPMNTLKWEQQSCRESESETWKGLLASALEVRSDVVREVELWTSNKARIKKETLIIWSEEKLRWLAELRDWYGTESEWKISVSRYAKPRCCDALHGGGTEWCKSRLHVKMQKKNEPRRKKKHKIENVNWSRWLSRSAC